MPRSEALFCGVTLIKILLPLVVKSRGMEAVNSNEMPLALRAVYR